MIDFESFIRERLARHAAEEAARTAPDTIAYGALDTLRETLAQLSPAERGEIVHELRALLDDPCIGCDFEQALMRV